MSDVKPIPAGCKTVSAYLIVPSTKAALELYAKAFGARPGLRMTMPGSDVTMHAEMQLGDSTVMLSDENPEWGVKSPLTLGGSPCMLHLYVADADATFAQAIAAGCEALHPMETAFWGDRYGKVKDPYGHVWGIATHVEDVSPEQCEERARAFFAEHAAGGCGE